MKKSMVTNVDATKMSPPLKIASTNRKYIIGCSRSLGMAGEKFCITINTTPTTNLSTKPIVAYTKPLLSTKYCSFNTQSGFYCIFVQISKMY